MNESFHTISPEDLNLFQLTDSVDEAVDIVYETHIGKRQIAQQLPRFASDETVPTGEGTRSGVQPRKVGLRPMFEVSEDGAI